MVKTSCNNYQRSGLRCLTSRTSRRLRRMRVYNPLASFEQAVQISQLFEKPEELRTDDYKGIEEDEAQAYNIVDLPDDVLVIIFNYVITPEYFMKHPLLESYKFGSSSRLACKEFYKLSSVCKRFRDFVHKYHSMFPQPTIGLTLQTPFGCSPNYGGCVVAYIYGDCGKQWPTKCVFIDEVPAAILKGFKPLC